MPFQTCNRSSCFNVWDGKYNSKTLLLEEDFLNTDKLDITFVTKLFGYMAGSVLYLTTFNLKLCLQTKCSNIIVQTNLRLKTT